HGSTVRFTSDGPCDRPVGRERSRLMHGHGMEDLLDVRVPAAGRWDVSSAVYI
ncbi:unnamed protein product, partial [Ectocarpus sp. 13 AM-2016]